MNFLELQDDVLERLSYGTGVASDNRTRVKRLLNARQQYLLSDPRFSKVRDLSLPLVTVQGQPSYGLPPIVSEIYRIWDPAGSNPKLDYQTPTWLRSRVRGLLDQGTPQYYIPFGMRPVFRVPVSTGTGLWAASSSAADTVPKVYCNAVRVGGYEHETASAGTTLTGTSRVALGARTDYIDITQFALNTACAGDITLYDAGSGGNALGVIPIGKTYSRFWVMNLYPVPSSALTYSIDYRNEIVPMANNWDEPLIPRDHHMLLSDWVRYDELTDIKKQFTQAGALLKQIQSKEASLLHDVMHLSGSRLIPGVPVTTSQGSNLGSFFPAGRW